MKHIAGLSRQNPMRVFTALLLGLSAAQAAPAEAWKDLRRPFGGSVTALAAEGGTFLLGTASGTVHRSADSGKSWSPAGLDLEAPVRGILHRGGSEWLAWSANIWDNMTFEGCYISRPGCNWGEIAGGLFRSRDDGRTWTSAGLDTAVTALAAMDGKLYAAGLHGLRVSPDGGATWQVPSPPPGWDHTKVADKLHGMGGNLFAHTLDRLWIGRPGAAGFAWTELLRNVTSMAPIGRHLLVSTAKPGSPSAVVRVDSTGAADTVSGEAFAQLFAAGGRLFGAGSGTLKEGSRDGAGWTALPHPIQIDSFPQALMPLGGALFAASRSWGPWKLGPGATAWVLADSGLHDRPVTSLALKGGSLIAKDSRLGFIRRSLAGGAWTRVLDIPASPATYYTLRQGGLLPFQDGIGLAGTRFYASASAGLWTASADGGAPIWTQVNGVEGNSVVASGTGWCAVFSAGRNRYYRCASQTGTCAPLEYALPQEQSFPLKTIHRFRAMALSGDSLAVILDTAHISADRGRTFRGLGIPPIEARAAAYHGGILYLGGYPREGEAAGGAPTAICFLGPDGTWKRLLAGSGRVPGPARVTALVSQGGYLLAGSPDGVFLGVPGADGDVAGWSDLTGDLPGRRVAGLAAEGSSLVASLEDGRIFSLDLATVAIRASGGGKPAGRGTPGWRAGSRRGSTPTFAGPGERDALRRADGRITGDKASRNRE